MYLSFISGGEIIIILFIVVLLFGANKLPEIARAMGKGMREFKKATNEIKKEISEDNKEIAEEFKEMKNEVEKYRVFENKDSAATSSDKKKNKS